jgi:hypothetical protein
MKNKWKKPELQVIVRNHPDVMTDKSILEDKEMYLLSDITSCA